MDAKQLAEQLAHEAELSFGELTARLALRNTTDSRAAATMLQQQDETIRLLHAEVERLRKEVNNNIEAHENAARHCDRLYEEVERLRNQATYYKLYMDALDRSEFDLSPCGVCGKPVVGLPDGLPLCSPCAMCDSITPLPEPPTKEEE